MAEVTYIPDPIVRGSQVPSVGVRGIGSFKSSRNSTTTPLGSNGVFAGPAELNNAVDMMVSCKTDQAGTLYVEFSHDNGLTFDASIAFPVQANVGEFHVFVKGPRYARVRYVNGSVAQGFFRLVTGYGNFNAPNAASNAIIQQDADARVVRPLDFFSHVKLGLIAGWSTDTIVGRNTSSNAGYDIWNGASAYPGFPTTGSAEQLEVFSSNANDTAAGTGARTVKIYGLDDNFESQTSTVTLSGTSSVFTNKSYRRVHRLEVVTAGSGESNAGTITVRHRTTTANVFLQVPATNNYSASAVFTVPAGYYGIIKRVHVACARQSSTGVADVSLRIRPIGEVFRAIRLFTVGNSISYDATFISGTLCQPKTDIKFRVESVSTNGLDIVGEFLIILFRQ